MLIRPHLRLPILRDTHSSWRDVTSPQRPPLDPTMLPSDLFLRTYKYLWLNTLRDNVDPFVLRIFFLSSREKSVLILRDYFSDQNFYGVP
ncbi:hypothetical protein E2C01_007951 [Portunus trituberculatus]|uniref:Uncharacterized protein n=1 Tax=Portunus trituberculatus TaxID=210409 RepID=A0A5B7CZH0_PORTR|nr:hypothetical protein [Portunus trituberculatus]